MKSTLMAVVCLAVATGGLQAQVNVKLQPETIAAFDSYVSAAEKEMQQRVDGKKPFLWLDENPADRAKVRKGELVIKKLKAADIKVPRGMLHDWIGVMFVPNTTGAEVFALFQDVAKHPQIYPEVLSAESVSRDGNTMRSRRLIRKKKVITAVLEIENETFYQDLPEGRHFLREYSRKINQIENYGKPDQKALPAGNDMGLLWRQNSYWRLRDADGGVYAELRSISLSRDVPTGLGWIVKPFIKEVPKESLTSVLEETRAALVKK